MLTFNDKINHATYALLKTTVNKCMYEVVSQQTYSWLATQYSFVYLQLILRLQSQLLCYKSCVLGHQYKSRYIPAMVTQLASVYTMLRAVTFPVQYTLSHYRNLQEGYIYRPVKAGSQNLHYHIINLYNNNKEVNSSYIVRT